MPTLVETGGVRLFSSTCTTKPVTGMVSSCQIRRGKEVASVGVRNEDAPPRGVHDGMSITVEGGRVVESGQLRDGPYWRHDHVPCDKESLNEAYTFATDWVSDRIEEAVARQSVS